MARLDMYVKVELEIEGDEQIRKLASEICRQIEKVYGVRKAEMTNYVERED